MSLAESVNLGDKLVEVLDREQPDNFHAQTGHILPQENSAVYKQLMETAVYAANNEMQINHKKTKLMLFNPCTSVDFMPDFQLGNQEIELVEEMRLLILRSDMKWTSNTEFIVKKGYKKLWMMRRLKELGANEDDLIDVYIKQIRSVLELAVPAWHGAITQAERDEIERVQKCALHIVLDEDYLSYRNALKSVNLDSLENRRSKLCLKFAKKAAKHPKHKQWFKVKTVQKNTRQRKTKYCKVIANKGRYKKSPIGYLTSLLNSHQ